MRRNHKKRKVRRRHVRRCVTGMNGTNQLQIAIIQIGKNVVHVKNYAILSPALCGQSCPIICQKLSKKITKEF